MPRHTCGGCQWNSRVITSPPLPRQSLANAAYGGMGLVHGSKRPLKTWTGLHVVGRELHGQAAFRLTAIIHQPFAGLRQSVEGGNGEKHTLREERE